MQQTLISVGNSGFALQHIIYWKADYSGEVEICFSKQQSGVPKVLRLEGKEAQVAIEWLRSQSDVKLDTE